MLFLNQSIFAMIDTLWTQQMDRRIADLMQYFVLVAVRLCFENLGLNILPLLPLFTLRWRHNDHDGVSNYQPHDCLLNRLFRRRSKKTSKLRVTGLCAGNSPETGEIPAQRASNAENIPIWWRHHDVPSIFCINKPGKSWLLRVIWLVTVRFWLCWISHDVWLGSFYTPVSTTVV